MDSYKKLSEELLKSDGIDPNIITEAEREMFKETLDKEMKHLNQTSWRSFGLVWITTGLWFIFVFGLLGLVLADQLFGKFHIPITITWVILVLTLGVLIFRKQRDFFRQINDSGRKVQKLHLRIYGKHKGLALVYKKNGKRYINWPNVLIFSLAAWFIAFVSAAGFYYLLGILGIGSIQTTIPVEMIIKITIISFIFVTLILSQGLKAPLEELTEIKPENYTCSRRKFSLINLAIILTVTLMIIYLFIYPQKSNEIDNHSSLPSLGQLTLAQQIARAPLIVRAVLENCNETSTRWRITKVLHGKVTDDFVDVSYFPVSTEPERSPESMQSWWHRIEKSRGKTLNAEEIWKEFSKIHSFWPTLGQEVILFLEKQDDKLYRYQGANYDVPPEHSLDEQEKLIQQVISSGAYKTAPIEDGRL